MSMNLFLKAVRDVTVNKTGKQSTQTVCFKLQQTPTLRTHAILASTNVLQSYIDFLMETAKDVEEDMFDKNDFMCETPIGTKIVNYNKEHVKKLLEFIQTSESEGYDIVFYMM